MKFYVGYICSLQAVPSSCAFRDDLVCFLYYCVLRMEYWFYYHLLVLLPPNGFITTYSTCEIRVEISILLVLLETERRETNSLNLEKSLT